MGWRREAVGWASLLAVAAAFVGPAATFAAPRRAESPLADLLEILIRPHELLAIDAEGGGQRRQPLELGERVLWHGAQGRIGVALTDRRILAVATGSAAWQAERYRHAERPPASAALGDRVALVVTPVRVVGFDGGSGNLIERRLGPHESVLRSAVGENVVAVVTDRRALGLSPFVGGFFEARIRLSERIDSLAARANHATLTTSQRLLIFRATSGSWEERRLRIQ